MTNTNYIIAPLPTDESIAREMLTEMLRECMLDIISMLDITGIRFDYISDYDDYAPAATSVAHAITTRSFDHTMTAVEIIADIFADDDLCDDLMTCDISSAMTALIDFRD